LVLGRIFPEIIEEKRLYGYFQQLSAKAYKARNSIAAISDVFGDGVVSESYGQLVPHTSYRVIFICGEA
jgi:hypothetical protein